MLLAHRVVDQLAHPILQGLLTAQQLGQGHVRLLGPVDHSGDRPAAAIDQAADPLQAGIRLILSSRLGVKAGSHLAFERSEQSLEKVHVLFGHFACFFAHLAAAAFLAISTIRFLLSFLARARPPLAAAFFPISANSPGAAVAALRLPRATAAGFLRVPINASVAASAPVGMVGTVMLKFYLLSMRWASIMGI